MRRSDFLGDLFRQLGFGKDKKKVARRRENNLRRRLSLEPLEQRELLSISTWVGGHGNNWSTAANWQANQVPATGAALVFSGTNTTTNDDITGLSVASIELSSNNFVLGGNALTVTSGVTDDSGVSGGTISLPIALGGPVTINAAGSTSALTISGVISGSNSLTEIGNGTVNLTGVNTYTGGTTIGNSLGTLAFAQGSLGTTGAITFSAISMLQWLPGNTQDISGRIAPIAINAVACFDTGTNSSITLAGSFSGTGGIAKYAGSGTLILTGANTMASSEVDAGTLQMGSAARSAAERRRSWKALQPWTCTATVQPSAGCTAMEPSPRARAPVR